MQSIIGLLIFATLVALTVLWRRRLRTHPFHAAFSATAAAGLLLATGLAGYNLRHGFFHATWTGGVIWWEIRLGILFSLLAVYFWRKSFQSLL